MVEQDDSAHTAGVGALIISQVLQALRLEIATRAGVDVFALSLPLLVSYVPQYLAEGVGPVAAFASVGRRLGFIRPSRRTSNRAPEIPDADIRPPPADLPLTRPPRYANRNCNSRPKTMAKTHE